MVTKDLARTTVDCIKHTRVFVCMCVFACAQCNLLLFSSKSLMATAVQVLTLMRVYSAKRSLVLHNACLDCMQVKHAIQQCSLYWLLRTICIEPIQLHIRGICRMDIPTTPGYAAVCVATIVSQRAHAHTPLNTQLHWLNAHNAQIVDTNCTFVLSILDFAYQ